MPRVTTQKLYDEIVAVRKLVEQLGKSTPPVPPPTTPAHTDLYVPETQASRFAAQNPNYPNVHLIKKIAEQPTAEWLGEWSGNVYDAVKSYQDKAGNKLAVYVAYNIPGRDNGNYSSGGLHSKDEYYSWIGSIGAAIADRNAWVILEPDALALSTDLDTVKRVERLEMIRVAVDILKKQPNLKVYLDASMWKSPQEMASLFGQAISKADGFSVNVSGFKKLEDCEKYANELSGITGKKYVIDTSRNGNGEWQTTEKDPWCNPPGRKIGNFPKLNPTAKCDAYLWIKRPGESDGTCRSYPSAGTFVPELAIQLSN